MFRFVVVAIVAGCSTASEPGGPAADDPAAVRAPNGVVYRADTAVLESFPVQLRTSVEATNQSGAAVDLTFPDGCVVLVRAYREGGSTPAWDQAQVTGCAMALVEVRLAPNEARTFEARTDARSILGDSLPDGRYRLVAYLRPQSGVVVVDAGTVDLAVPR